MKYEIYYIDGGHCGPFQSFQDAYAAALQRLNDVTSRMELRPLNSKAIGGYADNAESFYISKFGVTATNSHPSR